MRAALARDAGLIVRLSGEHIQKTYDIGSRLGIFRPAGRQGDAAALI